MGIKIITLIPTRGFVLTEVENAIDRELAANRQMPVIIRTHDLPLPVSRNFLVETALKQDWWTHALLVDDDIIMPKGSLKSLIKLNCEVAVTNYPIQNKIGDKYAGTVVRNADKSVILAGLGATLVKREVFEKMGGPWFACTAYRIRRDNKGNLGFFAGQQDGIVDNYSAGEDTHFFLQCLKNKFKIKVIDQIATHCRVDMLITSHHTTKYRSHHRITKNNIIERDLI